MSYTFNSPYEDPFEEDHQFEVPTSYKGNDFQLPPQKKNNPFKVNIPRPKDTTPAPMHYDDPFNQPNCLIMNGRHIDPNSVPRFPNPLPIEYQKYIDEFIKIQNMMKETTIFTSNLVPFITTETVGIIKAALIIIMRRGLRNLGSI